MTPRTKLGQLIAEYATYYALTYDKAVSAMRSDLLDFQAFRQAMRKEGPNPTVRYPRHSWSDKLSPGVQKPAAPSSLPEADR